MMPIKPHLPINNRPQFKANSIAIVNKCGPINQRVLVVSQDYTPRTWRSHAATLENGVDIEQNIGGGTALQWAAGNGHKDVLQFLLSAGAEASLTGPRGRTALHRAVDRRDVDRVSTVMAKGANRLAADSVCRTPLMLACTRGDEPVVMAFLLSTDTADIDMTDNYGSNPVSIAARHDHS
jgi:ankyrin repeat protein